MRARLATLLLLLALLTAPRAGATPRAPFAPSAPDACGSIAVPCAQIDDFNLRLRVSGSGFWGTADPDAAAPQPFATGGGASLAATLSLYKSAELSLSLPFASVRAPVRAWIYGPPEVRLRWRLGPRMGPGPFGAPWPRDEPYPKALPAAYDLLPAHWTLALGFRFQPLWPGMSGAGPRLCRATDSSCLAEVGLLASIDVRAWRLLATAHVEAIAAGTQSAVVAGGRLAADIAGVASLFSEAFLRQGIDDPAQRAGLVLVGGGLRGFRGAQLSAWYGRSFGGLSGDHLAGVAFDLPIDVLWGALQALSAAVDPFLANDGWIYDDRCAPLFALSHQRAQAAGITPGAHLWRCGDMLYHDQACTQPAVAVEPRRGAPAPVVGVASPWPDAAAARRYDVDRARWLERYAEAPDPARRALCEELVAQTVAALERAARDPTLGARCARALADKAQVMANVYGGGLDDASGGGTAMLGAQIWEAIACERPVSAQTLGAAATALRPGGGGITLAGARRPPQPAGVATHAPPAGAGAAPAAAPAAGGAAPGVVTHAAPPAGAAPAPRAAGATPIEVPPQWFPPERAPPSRQLPPGPQRIPPGRQLPPGPQPRAALPPPTVRWVPERATMAPRARDYQGGAEGARMSVQGQDLAPALTFRDHAGAQRTVRFDGVDGNTMIDRKLGVATYPKTEAQARRQAEALRQNGMRGRWEVPSEGTAAVARRMFTRLGIDVIDVVVVKP